MRDRRDALDFSKQQKAIWKKEKEEAFKRDQDKNLRKREQAERELCEYADNNGYGGY